jgi:hypothetical protein
MSEREILERLRAKLDAAGIPFMLVGSFASTIYGEPRSTRDIDIVIAPTEKSLAALIAALSPDDYYVSPEAAHEALRRGGMFNVIDHATGWKVDLIIRKDRPFSVEEFERRTVRQLFGLDLPVATVEDTILAKLEWAAAGESAQQLRDVEQMIAVVGKTLDLPYIERWADSLGVGEIWRRLFSSSQMR